MIMHFNNISRFLLVLIPLSIGFFVIPSHAEVLVLDRIYLIVNSQMLTRSEAQDLATTLKSRETSVEKTQTEQDKELLKNLLQEMLLLDRAEALKITPRAKEIESRFDRLAADQPKLLEIYAEEELKEQLAREFKKHHVISREVESKIRLETAEIELFCKQQLRKERKVGLAQILLQGSTTEVKSKVKAIRLAFKSGVSFEELAKQHSTDPNAKRTRGKLGIFKPADLLAKISEVTNNLEPGKISQVVQTNLGNHLLYIYKEEFAEGLDCSNLKTEQEIGYSTALYAKKRDALLDTYMDELFACANIEIKDPGISRLPASTSLPVVDKENINCRARRMMVLPQKKEKKKPKRQ
jgi:parvulin-like peptidyl-prolyl isomerase